MFQWSQKYFDYTGHNCRSKIPVTLVTADRRSLKWCFENNTTVENTLVQGCILESDSVQKNEMRKMCLKSTYKCENPSNCNLHISMSSLTNSLFCHCHRLNLFMSSTEGEVIFAKMQLRRLMTLFHTFFYLKQEMLHGFMVEFKVTNSIPDFYKFWFLR